jgi:hypothetical protein
MNNNKLSLCLIIAILIVACAYFYADKTKPKTENPPVEVAPPEPGITDPPKIEEDKKEEPKEDSKVEEDDDFPKRNQNSRKHRLRS